MSFSQLQIENALSGVVEKHRFLHSMVHIASFCEHMLARRNTVVIVHGCVPKCCKDNETHASQSRGYMHYTLKYIVW